MQSTRFIRAILATALLGVTAVSSANWTWPHYSQGSNAFVPITAAPLDLTAAPAWTSGPHALDSKIRPLILGGKIYAVKTVNNTSPTPDVIAIKAFALSTGQFLWETPSLDAGDSVNNGSLSIPVIDVTSRVMYYGSGTSVQAINGDTGMIIWSSTLTAANTAAGRAYGIVNSSPSVGVGKVYIRTTEFGSNEQVVALNSLTGAVLWSQAIPGTGVTSPLYNDFGAGDERLFIETDAGGNGGIVALNATTGATLWSSSTVTVPWNVGTTAFWADFVLEGGSIYGVSYDFSAVGRLVKVDALSGALEWNVASLGTDSPPIVFSGNAYVSGGGFGDAKVARHSSVTGAQNYNVGLNGGGKFTYRSYMLATTNALYLTEDDGFGSVIETPILRLDLATGAVVSSTPVSATARYSGAVSMDSTGALYTVARNDGSLRAFGVPFTSVRDWSLVK